MRFSDTQRLLDSGVAPLGGMGNLMRRLNIDGPLLGGLLLISGLGLFVLYSAVSQNMDLWLQQVARLGVAIVALVVVAQLPPELMRRWTPWAFP